MDKVWERNCETLEGRNRPTERRTDCIVFGAQSSGDWWKCFLFCANCGQSGGHEQKQKQHN